MEYDASSEEASEDGASSEDGTEEMTAGSIERWIEDWSDHRSLRAVGRAFASSPAASREGLLLAQQSRPESRSTLDEDGLMSGPPSPVVARWMSVRRRIASDAVSRRGRTSSLRSSIECL